MTDDLLIRWITGQANCEEEQSVLDWAEASEENQKELALWQNAWIWAGIDREMDAETKAAEITKILVQIHNKPTVKSGMRPVAFRRFSTVAAILLLMVVSAVGGFWFSHPKNVETLYTEVYVPPGERSRILLPDGSTVQLNGDTKIRFPASFQHRRRTVELEGEAFFNVAHNPSKPFVVYTPDLSIEVLGTTFNLNCYPNEPAVETYLESGNVKVFLRNKKYGEIKLKPSEMLQYERNTGKCRKIIYSDSRITDWTHGLLTVRSETIEALSKRLERRFNIKIQFTDEEVKSHTYTGSIRDGDLLTVLEAIKYASSLEYKRQGEVIVFSSGEK